MRLARAARAWATAALTLWLMSQHPAMRAAVSRQPPRLRLPLCAGDLVFRRGDSLASRLALGGDPSSRYSHVGIVVEQKGRLLVAHASPDGGPDDAGGVLAEPFESFASPDKASLWAVYRLRGDGAAAQTAAREAARYVALHPPFDGALDESRDDRLYCTELVWRSYGRAGLDLSRGLREQWRLGTTTRRAIPLSALAADPRLQLVEQGSTEDSQP